MAKYLYGASVQGIQGYIFQTNKLKEIVGASEIIKNINKKVEKQYEKNIIINAAGNVKLVFDESEKAILEELVLNFTKEVRQSAYGITISQAVVKFEEGGLKDAFEKLEKRLSIQRNRAEIPLDSSINILKLAPKTAHPAVEKEKDKAILLKEEASTSGGKVPKNKKNKTAIIHADGNGLGAMIASMTKNLKSDDEVIETYKNFSQNLEKATTNAFEMAKAEVDDKSIREVILGGDDMTVICNANDALEFTERFLEAFEQETQKLLDGNGLTACAGIAYCNHKYPFHYAVSLAESLCSYAKEHSKAINKDLAPSSLMFHNIQSSNFTDYKEYIDKELTLGKNKEKVYLNYGPYFTQKQHDYSTIESFRYLCEAMMLKGSPISRLREWLTILGQDATQAKERLLRINQMMDLKDTLYKKSALKNCFKQFNSKIELEELTITRDNKKFTPVYDIDAYLSVIDYTKEENMKECEK